MALAATIYRFRVTLSDVDRAVYEKLDFRVARHPSESGRYLVTRMLAYCLSFEEGIAFSKGGLSSADEPPISVRDRTGLLLAWIDVGSPSAERLHKAAKAAKRVALYTHVEPALLRRETMGRVVHRRGELEVYRLDPALLESIERRLDRDTELELVRCDGRLYVTIERSLTEGKLARIDLCGH
jgi:uncharacterized protein YaeQ